MDLHQAGSVPDWEKVPEHKRNAFQRVAAKTRGIFTPGNFVSVVGLGLVLDGIYDYVQGDKTSGIVKVLFGRLADIGDGAAANATGTKSSTGEAVDAGIDKIEMGVGLIALTLADIIPEPAAIVVGAQNIANVVCTGVAKANGNVIHPNRSGKYVTALQWLGMGGFMVAEAVGEGNAYVDIYEGVGWLATVGATATLGVNATYHYAQDAFFPQSRNPEA